MLNRRKFIASSALTAVGTYLFSKNAGDKQSSEDDAKVNDIASVIATWPNEKATTAAWMKLSETNYSLDAVEAGARVPEADVLDTSVGYGGYPDRDGRVTLDACIMDEKGNAGSVVFLESVMHPISVARKVMEKTPHVMLAGEGALKFALAEGFKTENLMSDHAKVTWEKWLTDNNYHPGNHDTIGILAVDAKGRLCGACSTSGWAFKMNGRIGDSPVLGAGLYVDGTVGAAACTGFGELVLKNLCTFLCVEFMRQGKSPQEAAKLSVNRLFEKIPGLAGDTSKQVGIVAMNVKGEYGAWAVHDNFKYTINKEGINTVFDSKFGK
jgi:N4-(beta-N-acetylglucosaminyl)-L-asparaginase